jgi:hypothetical protein
MRILQRSSHPPPSSVSWGLIFGEEDSTVFPGEKDLVGFWSDQDNRYNKPEIDLGRPLGKRLIAKRIDYLRRLLKVSSSLRCCFLWASMTDAFLITCAIDELICGSGGYNIIPKRVHGGWQYKYILPSTLRVVRYIYISA